MTAVAGLAACSTTPLGATETGLSAGSKKSPRGAEVFERECSSCHGKRGEGLSSAPNIIGGGALPMYARDPSTTGSVAIYAENQAAQDQSRARSETLRQPFRTAQDLFQFVSTKMPLPASRSGTLPEEDYWAVVNFILVAHGSAVPPEGITAANAAAVPIAAQ